VKLNVNEGIKSTKSFPKRSWSEPTIYLSEI